MGVLERRARHKEFLRQRILDAARDVFVKEGYESVSMRKIAEKIEYSPTTIYIYFKDKADLVNCLSEETFARLARSIERITHEPADPLERLEKGFRAYIEFGLKHPDHYRVAFMMERERPIAHQPLGEETMALRAFNLLRSAVCECIATSRFREGTDPETTAQSLWAAAHGIVSLMIVHPGFPFVRKDQLITATIKSMIAGLQA